MPRIKLTIEYDGSAYCGWQLQKKDKTIQGELERALKIILKKKINILGSGRTDAGVHARNQIAHCDIPEIAGNKLELLKIQKSINGILDNDIVVKNIEECSQEFHARFDAKKRLYRYYISKTPTAINRKLAWYISYPLNFTLMQKAADNLFTLQEFKTFCKTGNDVKTYECKIHRVKWYLASGFWVFEIQANRFLYGMVRAIVGLLTELGQGKITYKQYLEIINSQDRSKVKFSAPAHGLFLEEITY
ncbi:MAG: tRNA pseudouridine(38-40) synthase TruA [Calditrichaeota bacterium]|nr:MAG: tRNA pseudouridine(38-40) synthase TruA [Calditrichota bacterium]MBL1206920.1 tRNA pseudouridine(38-40) synthase TruA [Calditrichota bacterium]NOG46747.1 tRNA pseudouridine(38-40) synthase TruA [Calditrichota bacterium]